jgi:hypothetical protein
MLEADYENDSSIEHKLSPKESKVPTTETFLRLVGRTLLRYSHWVAISVRTNTVLHRLIGIILSIALASMHLGVRMPVTQRGIQCPTATVQQITEVKLVKDCCGKLVPQSTVRKPREGEPGFKQCRCAEKKAADHGEEKTATESYKPILVAVLSSWSSTTSFEAIDMPLVKLTLNVGDQAPPTSPPVTPPPQLV